MRFAHFSKETFPSLGKRRRAGEKVSGFRKQQELLRRKTGRTGCIERNSFRSSVNKGGDKIASLGITLQTRNISLDYTRDCTCCACVREYVRANVSTAYIYTYIRAYVYTADLVLGAEDVLNFRLNARRRGQTNSR